MINAISELVWRKDAVELTRYWKAVIVSRPILSGSFLTLVAMGIVLPNSFHGATDFIENILRAYLGYTLITKVWNDGAPDEEKVAPRKAPWVRLIFLEAIYVFTTLFLSLFLIFPGIWWAVNFSLSDVIVCLEDRSIIASLSRSYQLINRHWRLAAKYLLPMNLMIVLPTGLLCAWAGKWSEDAHKQSDPSSPLLAAITIIVVLTTAINLLAWLVNLGLVVRLYAYLKSAQPKIQNAVPIQ